MTGPKQVPNLNLLDEEFVDTIIDRAFKVLAETGVYVENSEGKRLLTEAGMEVVERYGKEMVLIDRDLVENSLESAPSSISIYGRDDTENPAMVLEDDRVHFDPGSAAVYYRDYDRDEIRKPVTEDFRNFVRVADALSHIDAQSTAMIPSDVPKRIGDLYRLFLALRNSSKPVVTGTFNKNSFEVMKDMQVAIRGDEKSLEEKPLTVFSVCPSPPLKWSDLTCHDLIECASHGIPAEFISMPMTGSSAPVTLAGALVQHTAETLSGVAIGQLANSGAPLIYGGSPTAFDMSTGTTPMGAIETMMIDTAYVQIGKRLGLPTQAYMGLSDSKVTDGQSGLEAALGNVMAALSGTNLIAGPGMLAFENCQSMEKLVIDNEICGMTKRLLQGISNPEGDDLAQDLLEGDIYDGTHFLTSQTTMNYFKEEFYQPSTIIDRNEQDVWKEKGSTTTEERAHKRVEELIAEHSPSPLPEEVDRELVELMDNQAKKLGLDSLPYE
ncbi:MAG: trimethylamine methyltransferase family protein [Candidatus Bipolaricaulia bacterium]